jgi:nitrogen fixation protein FixH
MECEMCTENDKEERLGKAVAVKVAEVQNMARHVLRNALVLWLSGQHLNRSCKSGEATKATGKQKWSTLRNVGIRYRLRDWGNCSISQNRFLTNCCQPFAGYGTDTTIAGVI